MIIDAFIVLYSLSVKYGLIGELNQKLNQELNQNSYVCYNFKYLLQK